MTRRSRRNHGLAFKAKVVMVAIKGEKTMVELAQEFDLHANQIKQWKDQLLEGAADVFDDGRKEDAAPLVDVNRLHAKIGELAPENDFLAGALGKAAEWKAMIDRTHDLSVSRQAKLLGINRGSVYYLCHGRLRLPT